MRQPSQVLVFPYRKRLSNFEILVLKRADDAYWQGVSGGGEGTESRLESAVRELWEETGLKPSTMVELDYIATVPKVVFKDWRQWPDELYVVTEFSFGACVEGEPILSREHSDYCWCQIPDAMELVRYDSNRTALWELNARLTQCYL